MVTDEKGATGTPEELWAASSELGGVPALAEDFSRLVVVTAHPDDETLGAAGLLTRSYARGVPIHVVVATDGERSHPRSPTHTPAQIGEIRREELLRAVETVAPGAAISFLSLPDGMLREHDDELRRYLHALLGNLSDEERAGTMLLAPSGEDGHRDHDAAGAVARAVAAQSGVRLLEYPVWLWHWSEPTALRWDSAVRLPLTPAEAALKAHAVFCHTSQVHELSGSPGDERALTADFLSHFERDSEVFFAGPSSAGGFDVNPDTRWHESRQRAIILNSLPDQRYDDALEVARVTGALTPVLAQRCERLSTVDAAELGRSPLPGAWPDGDWDLIVLAEAGSLWTTAELETALDHALASLRPGGVLLASHGRRPADGRRAGAGSAVDGRVDGSPLDGEGVHERIAARDALQLLVRHEEEDFILEVFTMSGSPARAAGLRA